MANHHDDEEHDRGLMHDLATLTRRSRRRDFLKWVGGAALVPFVGACISDDESSLVDGGTDVDAGSDSTDDSCSVIPEETAGPYPGDGSNGANVLALSGIVRSDITTSFAGATGAAAGIPLTIQLALVNTKSSCSPLAGYAVYLWHCDRAGLYSMYSQGVTDQNYLRGVQLTDAEGVVTFTSIFPACYSGRWPHIHFEIFPSLPTSSSGKIKTSQLALPKAACDAVFATSGYSASVSNLAQVSLASDNVFSDGSATQLATMVGNVTDGYTALLTVGVSV